MFNFFEFVFAFEFVFTSIALRKVEVQISSYFFKKNQNKNKTDQKRKKKKLFFLFTSVGFAFERMNWLRASANACPLVVRFESPPTLSVKLSSLWPIFFFKKFFFNVYKTFRIIRLYLPCLHIQIVRGKICIFIK